MGTIRFSLQTDVKDKEGNSPIQVVYQIQGQRKRKSTGQKAHSNNWDAKNQEAIYFKKGSLMMDDVKKINQKLTDIKRGIEKIEARFEATGKACTPEAVLNELYPGKAPASKKDTSKTELCSFIEDYLENHSTTRVAGSLTVYRSLKSHLEGYEKEVRKKVTFDKIDKPFFQSFQNYLVGKTKKDKDGKTVRALNNITIAKQLSTLKTFLGYASDHDIEFSSKYKSFKIERENDLEVIALTQKEFETLYTMDLSKKPAWDRVRDVFIFSCATGLRYSDLKQLRREHIKADNIDLTAVKTGHKTKVPLNPYSRAILKKYQDDICPLPVISNQRSNEHLGQICDWAGINTPIEIVRKHGAQRIATVYPKHELIRMHCGRKTFATLSLENGMRAEYVMKIGGWKDYKSFKRYMNITDDSTKGAMEAAWGAKVVKPKLKAV